MNKRRNYRHLTANDRDRIHALYGQGYNQSDVVGVLGVNKGTVSRELRRYGKRTWNYSATRAQADAEEKRSHSKRPGIKIAGDFALRQYIVSQLKRLRSPDEIAGRMRRDGCTPRVGTSAIYKWLYSDDGKPYCRYLCTRRTKKRCQKFFPPKSRIPHRKPLKDRPKDASSRARRGRPLHVIGPVFLKDLRSRGGRAREQNPRRLDYSRQANLNDGACNAGGDELRGSGYLYARQRNREYLSRTVWCRHVLLRSWHANAETARGRFYRTLCVVGFSREELISTQYQPQPTNPHSISLITNIGNPSATAPHMKTRLRAVS